MNLFAINDPPGDEENIVTLAQTGAMRIERIVSHGHRSAPGFWYDQDEDEWVCIVKGEGIIAFEDGRTRTLQPGDHLLIPAHCRHRVEYTANDTIWIAVFSRPEQAPD